MELRFFLTISAFFVISAYNLISPAYSENPNNFSDNSKKQSVPHSVFIEKLCAKVWKDIWPRAKNGDLEARFDLLTAIVAGPDVEPFQMPGSTGSWIDTYRDIVIMGVHTSNYFLLNEKSTDPKMIANYQTLVMQFANLIVRDGNARGAQFLNCVAEKKENCDDVAIKEGFVPDFNEYAQQIDKNIQFGVQGSCKSYFQSKK